jgi:hypothetical protein
VVAAVMVVVTVIGLGSMLEVVAALMVRRRRRGKGERQKRGCERCCQDPSHLAILLVPPNAAVIGQDTL